MLCEGGYAVILTTPSCTSISQVDAPSPSDSSDAQHRAPQTASVPHSTTYNRPLQDRELSSAIKDLQGVEDARVLLDSSSKR